MTRLILYSKVSMDRVFQYPKQSRTDFSEFFFDKFRDFIFIYSINYQYFTLRKTPEWHVHALNTNYIVLGYNIDSFSLGDPLGALLRKNKLYVTILEHGVSLDKAQQDRKCFLMKDSPRKKTIIDNDRMNLRHFNYYIISIIYKKTLILPIL